MRTTQIKTRGLFIAVIASLVLVRSAAAQSTGTDDTEAIIYLFILSGAIFIGVPLLLH